MIEFFIVGADPFFRIFFNSHAPLTGSGGILFYANRYSRFLTLSKRELFLNISGISFKTKNVTNFVVNKIQFACLFSAKPEPTTTENINIALLYTTTHPQAKVLHPYLTTPWVSSVAPYFLSKPTQ